MSSFLSLTTLAQEKRLSSEEAAQYLQVSPACLQMWRQRGKGPTYLKLGARVFYTHDDLEKFLEESKVTPEARHGNTHGAHS